LERMTVERSGPPLEAGRGERRADGATSRLPESERDDRERDDEAAVAERTWVPSRR